MRLKGSFLFLSFIFLISVYKASKVEACPDFYWYLMDGKYFLENKTLPENVYTFLPTKKWIAHSLYFEIILYFLYKKFGDSGVYFLKLILISFLFFLLIYIIYRKTEIILNFSFLYIPLYILFFWEIPLRPVIFAYLSVILVLLIIENEKYFLIPFILTFFSLFHLGIIASLFICGVYIFTLLIKKEFKKAFNLATYIFLSFILILIFNPYHLSYFTNIFDSLKETSYLLPKYITEWESLFDVFKKNFFFIIYLFFIFFIFFIFIISPLKKDIFHIFLMLLFFYFSLKHLRILPLFIVISVFIITPYLNEISKFRVKFSDLENKTLLKIIFVIINLSLTMKIFLQDKKIIIDENFFPVKAVNFLKNNRKGGNILCPSDRGGFVEYFLYPDFKISLDGRLSVKTYVLEEFFKFWNLEINPEIYIKKYKINFILSENKMGITKRLYSIPYLKVIYKDENFTIFELE